MHIQKGNPYSAPIEITYSDGSPYPLTSKIVFFTVKKLSDKRNDDTEALIAKSITDPHTDPINGITTLSLSETETDIPAGQYKADIRVYQAAAVQANSETFIIEIIDIVTKRIA